MLVKLIEGEDGEMILPLPQEHIEELGWVPGDQVVWVDNQDGSFTLKKRLPAQVETEIVLVETISTFKVRYLIEVPKGKKEYALDTVTLEEAEEISQTFLGEIIAGHRVIESSKLLDVINEDVGNEYMTLSLIEKGIFPTKK